VKRYDAWFISRVKAVLHYGFPVKVVSRLTGVPTATLAAWKRETYRATIAPDLELIEEVKLAILREL
jgi:hypothetical protein